MAPNTLLSMVILLLVAQWATVSCIPLLQLEEGLAPKLGQHKLDMLGGKLLEDRQEGRLPIPGLPDIEAIKKVAQILIMLGEQVIPAIVDGSQSQAPPHGHSGSGALTDPPNDNVSE